MNKLPEEAAFSPQGVVSGFEETAMKDDVAGLVEKLTPALKLLEELEVGQDCAEYAYAKGNGFQAMTYTPEAFEALRELPATLDALTTLSARVETLEAEALELAIRLERTPDEGCMKLSDQIAAGNVGPEVVEAVCSS